LLPLRIVPVRPPFERSSEVSRVEGVTDRSTRFHSFLVSNVLERVNGGDRVDSSYEVLEFDYMLVVLKLITSICMISEAWKFVLISSGRCIPGEIKYIVLGIIDGVGVLRGKHQYYNFRYTNIIYFILLMGLCSIPEEIRAF